MPQFLGGRAKYKPSKPLMEEWKTFRKGLNQMLRETELDSEELAVAENTMLVGKGVPTSRWGMRTYFTAGEDEDGGVTGIVDYKSSDGNTNDILALVGGFLYKKSSTGSALVSGQSWPSGSVIDSEQLGDETYIASEGAALTSYDGADLTVFSPIDAPSSVAASNLSGMSGPNQISYKVVAVSASGGQTDGSDSYVLANVPSDLEDSSYYVSWSAPSAATLSGYEVYRGRSGDETLLASVGPDVTEYRDNGSAASRIAQVPLVNNSGGVESKIITKYKDRLVAVSVDEPNKLLISGRYPHHTNFSWLYGGGYIYIDPDSGDNIVAVEVQPIADRIVVYKERSSYMVSLPIVEMGNYAILDPQYSPISTSVGCCAAKTVATVENDTFYFGRNGLYVTGYEPNFLNIIRTNEISAKIRPYVSELGSDDFEAANAAYIDKKYILSFPTRKQAMVYDRERGAWLGPWKFPFGITDMRKYVDSGGTERWIIATDSEYQIYRFDDSTYTDNGDTINQTLRTKKTYFGDWTTLGILEFFYVLFRNVIGTVTVNILIEDRDGTTSVAKSFSISGSEAKGSTGWGMDTWGTTPWGDSQYIEIATTSEELTRWGTMFKQARLAQVEVVVNTANSSFELLETKIRMKKMSRGNLSSTQRV